MRAEWARCELEQKSNVFGMLHDISSELSSTLELSKLYTKLHSMIREVMPPDGLAVSSFGPAGRRIRCEFSIQGDELLDHSIFPPLAFGGMKRGCRAA